MFGLTFSHINIRKTALPKTHFGLPCFDSVKTTPKRALIKNLIKILFYQRNRFKVAKGANFDLIKITGASLLFQTNFYQTVVLIIILYVK